MELSCKNFYFYFQGVFASIDKIFFLGGRLGTRFYFHEVLSRSATREATFVYQVMTNNQASFHLWWKKNLVKHKNSHNIMTMVVDGEMLSLRSGILAEGKYKS